MKILTDDEIEDRGLHVEDGGYTSSGAYDDLASAYRELRDCKAIQVWSWDQAPAEYKALSTHGGDEDGVIFIPTGVEEPWWVSRMYSQYGDEDRIGVATGNGTVIIWAHS